MQPDVVFNGIDQPEIKNPRPVKLIKGMEHSLNDL